MSGKFVERWSGSYWSAEHTPETAPQIRDEKVSLFEPEALPRSQCCGSVTFWYGSGSADQYLWLTDPDSDPDSAIFVGDLQDGHWKFS
jgi:hypothetical protein